MLYSGSATLTLTEVQWTPGPKRAIPGVVSIWPGSTATLLESLTAIQNWQDVGASTVRISQVEIELLQQLYTLREREKVLWFLEKYPFLVSLLLEAYVEVGNYFPHSRVFLKVFDDPEVEGMDKLFAYIRTPLPVDEALARLDKLDEEWFLDQLDRAAGRFNFNLEFA